MAEDRVTQFGRELEEVGGETAVKLLKMAAVYLSDRMATKLMDAELSLVQTMRAEMLFTGYYNAYAEIIHGFYCPSCRGKEKGVEDCPWKDDLDTLLHRMARGILAVARERGVPLKEREAFEVFFERHEDVGDLYWHPRDDIQEKINRHYGDAELRGELEKAMEHFLHGFIMHLNFSIMSGPGMIRDLLDHLSLALRAHVELSKTVIEAADAAENN